MVDNNPTMDVLDKPDVLLEDVYDFFYKKMENDFSIEELVNPANLSMERFKVSDYNLDSLFTKTPIKFIDKFPTGIANVDELWYVRRGEVHNSIIRIVPYSGKEVIDDPSDPVNVNIIIRNVLCDLVTNDRTDNILLPILNVDVTGDDLVNYEKIQPFVEKKSFYSVQLTEKFYRLVTLDKFLIDYPLEESAIKSIVQQAVNVLYQISLSYSGFHYNQLFPEMISCYLKQTNGIVIPELKLSNFYLAEIDNIASNNYLKKHPIVYVGEQYGDLYQLLNHLWKFHKIAIKKYPDTAALFDKILPKKIRSDQKYLTVELWDKLTEDEQRDLNIKHIRNSIMNIGKNILEGTTFVEQNDPSRLSNDSPHSEELSEIDFSVNNLSLSQDADSDNSDITYDKYASNKKYQGKDIDMSINSSPRPPNHRPPSPSPSSPSSSSSKFPSSKSPSPELTVKSKTHLPSRVYAVAEPDIRKKSSNKFLKSYKGSRIIRRDLDVPISQPMEPNSHPNPNSIGSLFNVSPENMMNQQMNQPMNQLMNQPMNQPMNQSMNQSMNQQYFPEQMNQPMNQQYFPEQMMNQQHMPVAVANHQINPQANPQANPQFNYNPMERYAAAYNAMDPNIANVQYPSSSASYNMINPQVGGKRVTSTSTSTSRSSRNQDPFFFRQK